MRCNFCYPNKSFKHLCIKQYRFWRLELGCNQYFLGKSLLILNRHLEDFMEISTEEQKELFIISKKVKKALNILFKPDKFNYSSLGNEQNHVHWHIVPRYMRSRNYNGVYFEDKIWGRNYAHYDKTFTISKEIEQYIVQAIQKNLQ